MKNGKSFPFVYITGLIALLLLQGCDKEIESSLELGSATAKQVDIAVLIPVHPSSLEYFDYCIFYSDNKGEKYRDTVRIGFPDNEIFYWRKNYAYKSLPVACSCEVALVPKVSEDSVVSFSYITPKPYIYSHVILDSGSTSNPADMQDMKKTEVMKIDNMRIDTFMSTYGSFFISTCIAK